jgi:lysophospholipase L1-like esterase
LGDSINDGHGGTDNGNNRWPDHLADRLQGSSDLRSHGVLNMGIGDNRLLLDRLGPNALARFDRDVLSQPGVRYLILLEGINDLGTLTRDVSADRAAHADLVARMIGAYRQMIGRTRDAGIRVYGATILPDGASSYYHPDALNEADRQAANGWIRTPGNFDAVIDWDAVMRDPADPRRMRKELDSGDGLHPSVAGYRVMAAAIPAHAVPLIPVADGRGTADSTSHRRSARHGECTAQRLSSSSPTAPPARSPLQRGAERARVLLARPGDRCRGNRDLLAQGSGRVNPAAAVARGRRRLCGSLLLPVDHAAHHAGKLDAVALAGMALIILGAALLNLRAPHG